jgi:hypothetical protein
MRRLPQLCVASLGLVLLLGCVGTSRASSLINFRLTNGASTPVSRVDLNVVPPGAIVPPVVGTDPQTGAPLTGSPVTILPGASGFAPEYFSVALGNKPGEQILRLLFGMSQTIDQQGNVTFAPILDSTGRPIGGFQPGGRLDFGVSVDPASRTGLDLRVVEGVPGLSIARLPLDDAVAQPPTTPVETPVVPTTPASQIPEPLPVLMWGAMLTLGLARVRTLRRIAGRR